MQRNENIRLNLERTEHDPEVGGDVKAERSLYWLMGTMVNSLTGHVICLPGLL